MPTTLTYSPVPHVPATAGTPLAPTHRYERYAETHPIQPLKGLRETRTAAVSYRASVPAGHGSHGVSPSYRALAPGGAGLPSGIEERRSEVPASTANYSLLTANSSFTSGNGTHTLYTYDSVSNITNITNSAAMLPNGLGGTYSSSYEYDHLYRLTNAEGSWQGLHNLNFHTDMGYHANGRIRNKKVTARTLLNGHSDTVNYARDYYYENPVQRNTLTRVVCFGSTGDYDLHYSWTSAGNMDTCDTEGAGSRRLCWDEQNRLQGVKDNRWLSYYLYDAGGDRTYKLTGKGELQNISGEWRNFYKLYNTTLYASSYLVATDKGYTKHYYAESERIASRIGGGRLQDLDQPIVENTIIDEKKEHINKQAADVLVSCLDARWYDVSTGISDLYNWRDSVQPEKECYWYHPDHLGSSSWITYSDGKAVQHLHYLPWGEDYVNQRLSGYEGARFTFSAKERDSETGLSYFGSRYYSSDLSIWLSVDPMSDKYASLSPYVYCADNPVKLVDPNGEDWYEKDGIMYYTIQYTSKEAFQKSGIKGTYKGKFFAEKGTYYSLFGDEIDMTTKKGFIKACMTQKIDEAFQNYANYLKAARNNNETPSFDAEPHSWDYPSQKQTDFSGVYKFEEGGATNNYHNPNELGKYANSADIYLFVSEKRMMGELDSFNRGLKYDRVHGVNGYGAIEGYLLQFKNYSGRVENPIVVLRFPSEESVRTFQAKFKNLFNIK